MKLITAIIKPFQLDALREALLDIHAPGITVTEVRGFGRQRGHSEMYRGAEYAVDFLPKLKVEIIAKIGESDAVIDALLQTCNLGKIGDGKIIIQSLENVIRIRTQEIGEDAI